MLADPDTIVTSGLCLEYYPVRLAIHIKKSMDPSSTIKSLERGIFPAGCCILPDTAPRAECPKEYQTGVC